MKKVVAVGMRERKRAANYTPADPIATRETSIKHAENTRAPLSTYVRDRTVIKYVVMSKGREEAAEVYDMRTELLGERRVYRKTDAQVPDALNPKLARKLARRRVY
jgi:hypothetical protein